MPAIARPKLPAELPAMAAIAFDDSLTLEEASVSDIDWSGQVAKHVNLDTVRFSGPILTAAKLRESGWTDVIIDTGECGGLDVTGSAWRRVEVKHARLSGGIWAEAELRDITFADCKLDLANFRLAKLWRVEFSRCQLSDADFGGAKLSDVTFNDCFVKGTDFSGTTMKSVDFPGCTLQDIKGISGLGGSNLTHEQIISLAAELAAALGIKAKP